MLSSRQPQKLRAGIVVLLAMVVVLFSFGYLKLLQVSATGLFSGFQQFANETQETTTPVSESKKVASSGSVQGVTTETTGEVKAVEDNITENSLVFRLRVFFLDAIEAASARFDTDLEVGNDVVIGNNLDVGNNLSVSGEFIAPNVLYSLLAGEGITLSGDQDITIANADTGSAQNIFKNFKVGANTISASSNDDTLTLEGGSGINLSNDGKTITIAGSGSDLNVSGWFDDGTAVRLVSSADNVGIGTSSPAYKLHVVGSSYFSGVANFASGTIVSSGINNSSGGITNAGSITGATGFTSTGTITFPDFSTGVLQTNVNGVVSSSTVFLGPGSTVISGVLPVSSGGTGISSLNTGDILYASASSTLAALGAGSDGEVLTISGGVPAWGTAGGSGPCATCIVDNPNSTQTITPQASTATAMVLKQASSGSVDVFRVENNDGSNVYFRIDSSGNVALGDNTTSGTFTVSPSSTDPITIDPVAQGAGSFEGTITSLDLTAARTWQFPDVSGVICLSTGNCSGTSASIGGSGSTNYLTKWSDTYDVTSSIVYDDGNNVGIGTTTMNSLLDVAGTLNVDALASFGGDVSVAEHATISGSLRVDQPVDFNSTLGVSGATTFGNTLDVTGLATFGGNVGIGSAAPSQKLDVVGAIRLGLAGANNVLNTSAAGGPPTGTLYWGDRSVCDSSGNCSGTSAGVGGSGTTNYVPKWSGTYGLTNSVIYNNGSNVGIGTTGPEESLHSIGNILLENNQYLKAKVTGGTAYNLVGVTTGDNVQIGDQNFNRMLFDSSARFIFNLGGSEVARIADGNLGIGSTAPTTILDIRDTAATDTLVSILGQDSGFATGYTLQSGASGANWKVITQESYLNNALLFGTGAPYQMVLSTDGKLGLGNTSPVAKFDVQGAVTGKALTILNETGDQNILTASASGTTVLTLNRSGNISWDGNYSNTNYITKDSRHTFYHYNIYAHNGGNIVLNADGHVLLNPIGNVGIGTSAPVAALDLEGDLRVFGSATVSASYAGGKALVVKATPSQTANLTEWQDSSGTAVTVVDENGNVGIGSDTPADKLDVAGNIGVGVYPNGRIYNNGDTDTYVEFGNNKARIQAGGVPSIQIDASSFHGNWANQTDMDFSWDGDTNDGVLFVDTSAETVSLGSSTTGLGVASDGSIYDIDSWVRLNDSGAANGLGKNYVFEVRDGGDTAFVVTQRGQASAFNTDLTVSGKFGIGYNHYSNPGLESVMTVQGAVTGKALAVLNETGDQDILTASSSGTTRFTIANNGNVGIGTITPNAELDVVGDVYFDSNLVARQDTNTLIQFNNNDQIELQAGGLRLLTLNETGSFTGSVTGNQNSHNIDFNWRGDTNSSMFMLDASSENVGIGTATPGQTLDVVGSARFSAVGSGTYANDLNLTSDGTLTTSSSDIRLKENLISMDDAAILSKVLQLQTYSFNWREDGSSDIGLIAQEVDDIFPEITFTNQTDGYMGINYSRLPTLLVSALQEQQKQLSKLKVELDETGKVVAQQEVQILGVETREEVLTVQEQLKDFITFADTIELIRAVVFKARTQFLATVEFMQEVRFRGNVRFNADTVGEFKIPTGSTRVRVSFNNQFAEAPTVFLSAQNAIAGGYQVEEVTSQGFIVSLAQPQLEEVRFDWLAVLSETGSGNSVEVLESNSDTVEIQQSDTNETTSDSETIPSEEKADTTEGSLEVETDTSVEDATKSAEFVSSEDITDATNSGSLE